METHPTHISTDIAIDVRRPSYPLYYSSHIDIFKQSIEVLYFVS